MKHILSVHRASARILEALENYKRDFDRLSPGEINIVNAHRFAVNTLHLISEIISVPYDANPLFGFDLDLEINEAADGKKKVSPPCERCGSEGKIDVRRICNHGTLKLCDLCYSRCSSVETYCQNCIDSFNDPRR